MVFRVSELDSLFFEKFGSLIQRHKERELIILASKSPSVDLEVEQVFLESIHGSSMPGMTWDNLPYTSSFTFHHGLQKKDVS